jgi:5-hydroxyisourate hydrolase-like protein (transthyretin family)
MYDPPLFAGAQKLAFNATDGSLIWTLLGFYARVPSAIADGYLVGYNSYDAQIYTFGKGPSQTTVSAPNVGVAPGQSVTISGTVLDTASGTTDNDRSARFPNGVACVSDESQSAWMEYVYMQQEMPTNTTGVNVQLYVLDANNNYRLIGTTTTDTNGYYSFNWMPDITGAYKLYAVFEGTNSYYSSQATTAFAVDPVAATVTPQSTSTPSMADLYFMPMSIAIIVAVIVIGVVLALLLLRKHA